MINRPFCPKGGLSNCFGAARFLVLHEWFETGLEETQVFWFINHIQALGLCAVIVNSFNRFCNDIHVGLRVYPAWYRQAVGRQVDGYPTTPVRASATSSATVGWVIMCCL